MISYIHNSSYTIKQMQLMIEFMQEMDDIAEESDHIVFFNTDKSLYEQIKLFRYSILYKLYDKQKIAIYLYNCKSDLVDLLDLKDNIFIWADKTDVIPSFPNTMYFLEDIQTNILDETQMNELRESIDIYLDEYQPLDIFQSKVNNLKLLRLLSKP